MRKNLTAEQMLHTLRQAESGTPGGGSMPEDRDHRTIFLQVQATGCGHGDRRVDAVATVGRREQEVESTRCGPDSRQAHASRGAQKKVLKPARKRAMAVFLRGSFQISERRACRVLKLQRPV
jgi:hypothetical protein